MQGKVGGSGEHTGNCYIVRKSRHILFLSHFPDNCIFYTLEVCDNPEFDKSINLHLNNPGTLRVSVSHGNSQDSSNLHRQKTPDGPDDHWSFVTKSVWSGQTGWLFSYLCTNPAPAVHPMHPIHPMTGFFSVLVPGPQISSFFLSNS